MTILDRPLRQTAQERDEAAHWLARLRSGQMSSEQTQAFEAWIGEAGNAAAFARAERLWQELGGLREDPKMLALREQARDSGHRRARARKLLIAAGVAGLALTTLLLGHRAVTPPEGPRQEMLVATSAARGLPVTLMDGSVMTVDAHSKVHVVLAGDRRSVRIEHGRAHFQVAKDPARPFVVTSGDHAVIALGTSFVVDRYRRQLTVDLLEGRVQVKEETAARKKAVELVPGMRLEIAAGGQWTAQDIDRGRAVSWMQGKLIFENDRLADVVSEMNRYLDQPIIISEASVGNKRLTAVLNAGDARGFTRAIEALGMAEAAVAPDGRIMLGQK
ncbi:MAG TPA: FecR domain-containing protein [Pedomonas sp.]|uniref:FecR family protein n=1 Tax=Pedomonas sp. TaxID=2976421 RepID=UPI002F3FEE4D